jgi:hypothetical protein
VRSLCIQVRIGDDITSVYEAHSKIADRAPDLALRLRSIGAASADPETPMEGRSERTRVLDQLAIEDSGRA